MTEWRLHASVARPQERHGPAEPPRVPLPAVDQLELPYLDTTPASANNADLGGFG